MKLKIRNRTNGTSHNIPAIPKTAHGDTLRELVSVQRKLDALETFPANKLTAESYLRETLEADPSATMQGVRKLRSALSKNPPSLEHTQRALAKALLDLKSINYPRPPSKYPQRLVTSFGSPECTAELIRHHSNMVELFAVAVMISAERNSGAFGTCESTAKHDEQVAELKARREELYKKADSDLKFDEDVLTNDDPRVPPVYKVAPEVPLAPRGDSSARLVAYLMQKREQSS